MIHKSKLLQAVLIVLFCFLLVTATAYAGNETSLSVEPSSGKPAAGLIISGSGFAPGEENDVQMIIGHTPHGLGTGDQDVIEADGEGNFVVESAIPAIADPGSYQIEATGNEGNTASHKVRVLD